MKTTISLIFVFFLLADTANSANFMTSDDYWKGKTAYMKGDHKLAFDTWIGHAEAGVPEAQGLIANLYHAGQGVTKNFKQAFIDSIGKPAQCLILLILSSSIAKIISPFFIMHALESPWYIFNPII